LSVDVARPGIKLAGSPDEARQAAADILGMDIKGLIVDQVLVEQQVDIDKEYYAELLWIAPNTIHSHAQLHGRGYRRGGASTRDRIKTWIDPAFGRKGFQYVTPCSRDFDPAASKGLQQILAGLYRVLVDDDALLAEINPLAVTKQARPSLRCKG
jgi:succinyl-CoA synthetase beta subunit